MYIRNTITMTIYEDDDDGEKKSRYGGDKGSKKPNLIRT